MTEKRVIPNNSLFIGIQSLWVLSLILIYLTINPGTDRWVMWIVLGNTYFLFARQLLSRSSGESGTLRILSLNFLFYVGAYLVFLFPYQLYLFDFFDLQYSTFLLYRTYTDSANAAVILSGIALGSFSIGWEIGMLRSIESNQDYEASETTQRDRRLSLLLGVGLLVLIATYLLSGQRSVAEQRYIGGGNQSAIAEAIYFTATLLSMLSFALWIYIRTSNRTHSNWLRLAMICSAFWEARLLINGDRNSFFLIAILQLAGYGYFIRRPSLTFLVVCSLLSVYLYVIIENFRTQSEKSFESFVNLGKSSKFSLVGETSLNITTISLRASLELINESGQYFYGMFKAIGLLGLIPFSRGLLLPSSIETFDTSALISEYIFGRGPHWQVGTNLISDSYIDFGLVGVVIILFMYGFFGSRVQVLASVRRSLWNVVLVLLLLPTYFQLPRYSADFPLRMLAWSWLLLHVVRITKTKQIDSSTNLASDL